MSASLMPLVSLRLITILLATGAGSIAVAAAGADPALGRLDALERGAWELRHRDASRRSERICLTSAARLIQLRHPGQTCDQVITESTPTSVTVQYTCSGRGYGRTTIRRETGRLVQVQSQGIVDGLPFELSAEARRVGDCTAS